MLVRLKIKNIALIDECVIDFRNGLNTLTGETGAGKSIIIDSLNFVLGARGDKGLIKSGTDGAKVEAVFDTESEEVLSMLEGLGLERENTIILSRTLNVSGKNECRINGEIATLNMLKKIAQALVDVFGQNDQQFLLDTKQHISFLDAYSCGSYDKEKREVLRLIAEVKAVNSEIESLGGDGAERERNIDLIKYQINEITVANLKSGEEEELDARKSVLLNSEKIAEKFNELDYSINGNLSVVSTLKNAKAIIDNLCRYVPDTDGLTERFGSAIIEIEDVLDDLGARKDSFEYSESELDFIEDRLDTIKGLKRKYGENIEKIFEFLESAEKQLTKFMNATEELEQFKAKKRGVLAKLYGACARLTEKRKAVAIKMESEIKLRLKTLGMKNADFKVFFKDDYTGKNIEEKTSGNGADDVEFLFSANLGEPLKPLVRIISGGELSRFMLAFKTVANSNKNKTYVFDEIDTGIGGEIGVVVGEQMCDVARGGQVLCVTHLAQIASFGDNMLKISKRESGGRTYTNVSPLNADEKVNEIARMIGAENGEYSKLYARELVNNSNNYKLKN